MSTNKSTLETFFETGFYYSFFAALVCVATLVLGHGLPCFSGFFAPIAVFATLLLVFSIGCIPFVVVGIVRDVVGELPEENKKMMGQTGPEIKLQPDFSWADEQLVREVLERWKKRE